MLDNLTQRLARVVKTIRGEARLTEANIQDALREVRVALLEADVALPVVRDFISRVRDAALGQDVAGSLTPGQALVGVVHRELTALMGGENAGLDLAVAPTAVVLLAGLQGSGKTTTAAKLAKLLKEDRGKNPLLVSCDVSGDFGVGRGEVSVTSNDWGRLVGEIYVQRRYSTVAGNGGYSPAQLEQSHRVLDVLSGLRGWMGGLEGARTCLKRLSRSCERLTTYVRQPL